MSSDKVTIRIAPQGRWQEIVEGIRRVCEECGYDGTIQLTVRGEVEVSSQAIEIVDRMPPPPIPQITIKPHPPTSRRRKAKKLEEPPEEPSEEQGEDDIVLETDGIDDDTEDDIEDDIVTMIERGMR